MAGDRVPFFDLRAQVVEYADEVHAAVDEVLRSGYFIGGDAVERFESEWAARVGAAECVGVGNGLDAIRLILEGYGIGEGDEVIVPAFTYYASWLAVMQVGATLVPVDVDLESAAVVPELVRAAITPATRAILAVHLYGIPADLRALRAIADEAGILLIEDAAQAHGAEIDGIRVGAGGHAAAFSFYPTKNLGALGDAGGVTTSDPELARRVRSRGSYGQGESKYDHVDTGWNSRLDPIQAAILSVHLGKLEGWLARRREIAAVYAEAIGRRRGAFVGPLDTARSVWHHFVLRARDREALRAQLAAAGVSTDVHYPYDISTVAPVQPFLPTRVDDAPNSAMLGRQVVSLPIGPWMTDSQVAQVAEALRALPSDALAD